MNKINYNPNRMTSNGSISNVKELGEFIQKLLNKLWGSNWGVFAPAFNNGGDNDKLKMPRIVYSLNLREIPDNFSPVPKHMGSSKEVVDGQPTGDTLVKKTIFFNSIVEFDIIAETYEDCFNLCEKFEEVMIFYLDYFKQSGLSNIFFLKEIPPSYSLNFAEGLNMKCLLFNVMFEKSRLIRSSVLDKIEETLHE